MWFALRPPTHFAPDNVTALHHSLDLACRFARPRGDTRDDGREAILARIEHILAQWARRLQRSLSRAPDHPAARQHRMALRRCLLQQISDQRPTAPGIGRVVDATGLGDGELVTHCLVWEEAAVDCAEGDRIEAVPVPLEEQVGISNQLSVGDVDAGVAPLGCVVEPQRLILADRAAAQQLEQGTALTLQPLPAITQTRRKNLRQRALEPRGVFHHSVHELPWAAAALALAPQLDLVGQ